MILWLKFYGNSPTPFSHTFLNNLYVALDEHFCLPKAFGTFGRDDARAIPDVSSWLRDASHHQAVDHGKYGQSYAIVVGGRPKAGHTSWVIYSELESHHSSWTDSASLHDELTGHYELLIGIDVHFRRATGAPRQFIESVVTTAMHSEEWVYGFVDPVTYEEVATPPFYLNTCHNPGDWNKLVDQERWNLFVSGSWQAVRGIYWGNFLSGKMASVLYKSGGIDFMRHFQGRNWEPWPQCIANSRSVFVQLSQDPVHFGKNKHELTSGPDPTGRAAAIFKEALSRASLL